MTWVEMACIETNQVETSWVEMVQNKMIFWRLNK